MNSRVGCQLVVFAVLGASSVWGQPNAVERFERQRQQIRMEQLRGGISGAAIEDRALLEYGGFASVGYFSLDDSVGENHVLRQYELLGYFHLNFDDVHDVFVRGRIGYRDFNDGDSFDGRGDEPIDGDLDIGFYRFDLRRYVAMSRDRELDWNLQIQAGRDLAFWGNGLVLARVLDGVKVEAAFASASMELIAGITSVRTVDFDSSRPSFDHNTRRAFYGGLLSFQRAGHRPYAYALYQQDLNHEDSELIGDIPTEFQYDSYYLGAGMTGQLGARLLYAVEVAFEGGSAKSSSVSFSDGSLSPAEQQNEAIAAAAVNLRLDYLPNDIRRSRLSAELTLASGDDDRAHTSNTFGGNRAGTSDRAFNAFGVINTGLAFAPPVSNLIVARGGASTFPFDTQRLSRLQVGTDLLLFWKADADAPIDEITTDSRYLGFEADLFMNWQITSDFSVAVRYGVFFPGEAILNDSTRQFIFVGATYAF